MIYNIPVTYTSWGLHQDIEADSLEEARRIAKGRGLPPDAEYVDDSLEVDDESIMHHNDVAAILTQEVHRSSYCYLLPAGWLLYVDQLLIYLTDGEERYVVGTLEEATEGLDEVFIDCYLLPKMSYVWQQYLKTYGLPDGDYYVRIQREGDEVVVKVYQGRKIVKERRWDLSTWMTSPWTSIDTL